MVHRATIFIFALFHTMDDGKGENIMQNDILKIDCLVSTGQDVYNAVQSITSAD